MYPQQDLIGFARQKAALRDSIALRRERCAGAAARAAQPVEFVDRAWAFWRDLSPLVQVAAVPLGVAVARALFPRYRILRKLVRWAPLAIAAVRAVGAAKAGDGTVRSSPAARSRVSESATR